MANGLVVDQMKNATRRRSRAGARNKLARSIELTPFISIIPVSITDIAWVRIGQ